MLSAIQDTVAQAVDTVQGLARGTDADVADQQADDVTGGRDQRQDQHAAPVR